MIYTSFEQLSPYQKKCYVIGNVARRRQNEKFAHFVSIGEYDTASEILNKSWTEYTTPDEKSALHIKPREPAQTGTIRNDSEQKDLAYQIGKAISRIIRRVLK